MEDVFLSGIKLLSEEAFLLFWISKLGLHSHAISFRTQLSCFHVIWMQCKCIDMILCHGAWESCWPRTQLTSSCTTNWVNHELKLPDLAAYLTSNSAYPWAMQNSEVGLIYPCKSLFDMLISGCPPVSESSEDQFNFLSLFLLQNQIEEASGPALTLKLTLAQLHLTQGHVNDACKVLQSLGDYAYKPGVVMYPYCRILK